MLAAEVNEPVVEWGLPDVHATAVRVAELAGAAPGRGAVHVDTTDAVLDVLRAFWVHPTEAEAAGLGHVPVGGGDLAAVRPAGPAPHHPGIVCAAAAR